MGRAALSARMRAVADLVTKGSRVCDVGCDHGYIPIYLIQNQISPRVLAMDINKGPLARAAGHIQKAGLEDYITLRRSDGLAGYAAGEADTLILAGMGGRLMAEILGREPSKAKGFRELILQPQSEIPFFRKFLREAGYFITWEDMVLEEGKFYTVLRTEPGEKAGIREEWGFAPEITEDDARELSDRFGPVLLKNRHPVLVRYLRREWESAIALKDVLERADGSPGAGRRLAEIGLELQYMRKAADICGCGQL